MPASVRFLTMRMLLLFLLSFFHHRACHSSPSMQPRCQAEEGNALLQFKESLVIHRSASFDPYAYPKVASWKVDGESSDCCSWDGVECDRDSGHVIGLDLSSSCLFGSIDSNSSLFHLVQLRRLNLADNDFNNSKIPSGIRNLSRLFDLNLSMSVFSGVIPSSLGNLTTLNYLDLSHNTFSGKIPSTFVNLLQLTYLSLSSNNFSSGTLHWLCNLTKLTFVGLNRTNSYGEIPSCLGNLTQLTHLNLNVNELTGQIPSWMGNQTKLILLGLGDNKLHGPIPDSIFRLPNLETLNLVENLFSGTVEFGILKSRSLVSFQLSDNNLSVIGNHNDSAALPKIQTLGLGGCNLSGEFPSFLHGQNHLEFVELGGNKIEGHIPTWFMNLGTETLWHLDLIGNLLTGFEQSVDILPWNNLRYLRLSFNKLDGALPIPPHSTIMYMVSDNRLNGEIPPAICNLTSLVILQLSNNNLSGKLPQCLGNISNSASVLDLRNNSFSGDIPEAFSSDCALRAIDFSQNQLEGKIRKSLANCTKLEILSIEQNKITDVFPSWLGILPKLRVLILRSNRLHGVIGKPKADFEFQRLQIVDLSGNCFFGKLPLEYFRNWSAMKTIYKERPLYMQVVLTFQLPRPEKINETFDFH
ncbi:receptor-like protein 6 [Populus alba x Populus x berolinensis]|uniref:Receptor-like protein 6 n=1 Tax=Populus alba x Populus x berolinensis TaxID=444605 RepID=A0AAD6LNQ4_9ROSI|nr:receptor-like protein 6 [Populus alba x Populus x berolinensis]